MLTVAGYSLLHSTSNCGWLVNGSGNLRNFTQGELVSRLSHLHGMAARVSAAAAARSAAARSAAAAATAVAPAVSPDTVSPVRLGELHPERTAAASAIMNKFLFICKAEIFVLFP